MTNSRTTNTDRLDFLRLFKECLTSHQARGDDLEDVIKTIDRAISRRERMEMPR